MKPRKVVVHDKMQHGYVYYRTQPVGRNFAPDFRPALTPKQVLQLGAFSGKYMTDCRREFPASWFVRAKLCAAHHDPKLNYFGVNASQPLSVWRKKGRIAAVLTMRGRFDVEGDRAARRADPQALRARRSRVPAETAAGCSPLGLRQP